MPEITGWLIWSGWIVAFALGVALGYWARGPFPNRRIVAGEELHKDEPLRFVKDKAYAWRLDD